MRAGKKRKIVRLLAVGFDAEDGHIRLTQGEKHDVLMGSAESHEYLQKLILRIEEKIESSGLSLEDIDPGEFSEWVGQVK
jgi:hypothetical protein